MGLLSKVKTWAAKRQAESLGKKLAAGGAMDWLKRNKVLTGIIVWALTGATSWAAAGCAPAYDQDILAILHVSCGTLVFGLMMLGSFLVGAGIMTSDKHAAVKQGLKAPEGRPAVPPPAEVKRVIAEEIAIKEAVKEGLEGK